MINVHGNKGDLDLLFVSPEAHSKGIGYAAWCAIEKMHPEVTVWETVTPYFEKRNIHFYVKRGIGPAVKAGPFLCMDNARQKNVKNPQKNS